MSFPLANWIISSLAPNVGDFAEYYIDFYLRFIIVTALHGMQTRSSDENYVCPSVKRVHCDKPEERSLQILYHTKDHLA